jgi:hypothetical protein
VTDLSIEVILEPTTDGDHERFKHIVIEAVKTGPGDDDYTSIGNSVVEGTIYGTPVVALCGKTWVPGENPKKYPLCPTCKAIAEERGWKVPSA